MDNEDVIRERMEETRTSLTEKLETLESEVTGSVQATTENVVETVESVKDAVQETVDSVKDGLRESMDTVTDSVKEGVEAVKSLFDVSGHVERHPAAMFAGAMALGFFLGHMRAGSSKAGPTTSESDRPGRETGQRHGNGKHAARTQAAPGFLAEFAPEINKLKGLALGALMGLARELIMDAIPANMNEPVSDVIKSVTEKLGGTSMPEAPVSNPGPQRSGFAVNRM